MNCSWTNAKFCSPLVVEHVKALLWHVFPGCRSVSAKRSPTSTEKGFQFQSMTAACRVVLLDNTLLDYIEVPFNGINQHISGQKKWDVSSGRVFKWQWEINGCSRSKKLSLLFTFYMHFFLCSVLVLLLDWLYIFLSCIYSRQSGTVTKNK